jgi:hypothetical protein
LIKDFNVKSETFKLRGKTFEDIGMGNAFLNNTPLRQEIRARTDTRLHQNKKP